MDVKEKKMEENFKYHIPEEIPANERTAFHGAAAAAAKAGKKSFNFGGKSHPVTMKKDTAKAIADQKESTMTFREKLLSLYEGDRKAHYKSAAEAEPMDNNLKGAGAKKMKLSISINSLPPEMVENILKLLNIKKICQARFICKQWKEIIDKGNLLKKASGKLL